MLLHQRFVCRRSPPDRGLDMATRLRAERFVDELRAVDWVTRNDWWSWMTRLAVVVGLQSHCSARSV